MTHQGHGTPGARRSRTRDPGQDIQDKTSRTRHPGQDIQDKTSRVWHTRRKEIQDKTSRTRHPGQGYPMSHSGHDTPGACDPGTPISKYLDGKSNATMANQMLYRQTNSSGCARDTATWTRHPGQGDPLAYPGNSMAYQDKTCQPICTLRALRSLGMAHQGHATHWHTQGQDTQGQDTQGQDTQGDPMSPRDKTCHIGSDPMTNKMLY
jgi:hypothetical protein